MYNSSWNALANGECIGICPEGSTHDLLQLQPFKAGMCIMALGAIDKHHINVTMVPCAIHYFRQNWFRSKVIL
jgi:glycerol-3-phosphate O-acyltransferase / dihydroxyacetone phosphate acyltransferase